MAPLTPSQTLQVHSSSLTGFEQSEILQFSEIYFWGLPAARKHEGTPHLSELNHGCASRQKEQDSSMSYTAIKLDQCLTP